MHKSALLLSLLGLAAATPIENIARRHVAGEYCDPRAQDAVTDAWFYDSDLVTGTNPHWSFSGSSGVSWDFNVTGHNTEDTTWPDPLRGWRLHFDRSAIPADGKFTATATQLTCTYLPFSQSFDMYVGGQEGDLPHGARVTISLNGRKFPFGANRDIDHLDFCTSTGTPHASAACDHHSRFNFCTPERTAVTLTGIDTWFTTPGENPAYRYPHTGRYIPLEILVEYTPQDTTSSHIPDVWLSAPWLS